MHDFRSPRKFLNLSEEKTTFNTNLFRSVEKVMPFLPFEDKNLLFNDVSDPLFTNMDFFEPENF